MVSQDSPSYPTSLNQFDSTHSIPSQGHFSCQNFDDHGVFSRGNNGTFPQHFGLLPNSQSVRDRIPRSMELVQAQALAAGEADISNTRHLMNLLGAASDGNQQYQGLSLSLGSQILVPPASYRQRCLNSDFTSPSYVLPGEEGGGAPEAVCNTGMENVQNSYPFMDCGAASSSSPLLYRHSPYGTEAFASNVGSSRYLKAAQSLLEEVASVGGKAVDISKGNYLDKLFPGGDRRGSLDLFSELKSELYNSGNLSAEKQEGQIKIAKLLSLLEEVEVRYQKYHHQMEEVVSSFETIAGINAAKSYTALALQAMSRHFCSLRDAIIAQINIAKRKLHQDLPKISRGLSRLGLIDQDSRHNRISLQQIGLMHGQRQAWRPIRGLPETSVSILRAWLFEHFLHPYPNDSEKLTLASQTGLSKNQVSNWFINARVRLWKPMIEEMYKEEFADSSEDYNYVLASSSISKEGTPDGPDHDEE